MTRLMHPYLLWLLLLIPLIIWWYVKTGKNGDPTMKVSSTRAYRSLKLSNWRRWLRHVNFAIKLFALACLIVILCRPLTSNSTTDSSVEGTDIVLALDISSTMLARDINPDRLSAAQAVATQFVNNRENDNMALVIFAGEAFTQVPLTTDMSALVNQIAQVKMGLIDDGTAIGDGITTAINRLRNSKAKSKSIILLTDGTNNTGIIAPITAAQVAKEMGIKIYTIGVGTNGVAQMPISRGFNGEYIYGNVRVEIDENTLQKIAQITGGRYFRATSKSVLQDVFKEIDKLDKSRIDRQTYSSLEDNYQPWALALLALVVLAIVIDYTLLRHIP